MSERVLIFGSRNWTDPAPIRAFVQSLPDDAVVIHGAAPGAAALNFGLRVIEYPAKWTLLGRRAGPVRNQQMIDEGKPTRARGFRTSGDSRGTDDMTSRLIGAGIPVEITHGR